MNQADIDSIQQAQILMSLINIEGINNRTALNLFESTHEQWTNADPYDYFVFLANQNTILPNAHVETWDTVENQLELTHKAGIHILSYFDALYPERLREINDPPVVLFVKGSIQALQHPRSIAIVGTREPTEIGERSAFIAGKIAAQLDISVVSGLAVGCDTKAHKGCVDLNGTTVAVLANSLDNVYPPINRDLAKMILDTGGCLVSETPVGAKLHRWSFAHRNRIQSGLSDRVLVIETDVKGGTMHTVKFAQQQKRPLACINHPEQFLRQDKTRGNQMLINNKKAIPITNEQDLKYFINGIGAGFGSN